MGLRKYLKLDARCVFVTRMQRKVICCLSLDLLTSGDIRHLGYVLISPP